MSKNWRDMPGPGDPETWGPYAGHPLDPRGPDLEAQAEAVYEKRLEIGERRIMKDMAWLHEAFSEASDKDQLELWHLFREENMQKLGELVSRLIEQYTLPPEEDARKEMEEPDEEPDVEPVPYWRD